MSPSSLRATATTPRTLHFDDSLSADPDHTLLIGKRSDLEAIDWQDLGLPKDATTGGATAIAQAMLQSIPASSQSPTSVSTFLTPTHRLSWGVLPATVSRHNHPYSVSGLPALVASALGSSSCPAARIVFCGIPPDTHDAVVAATAKAFPLYSKKTKSTIAKDDEEDDGSATPPTVHIHFANNDASSSRHHAALAAAVRRAGRLMDMPPAELTTTAFAEECRAFAAEHPTTVTLQEIVGSELRDQGYGGIYGVGQGAVEPPRLVILEYTPPTASAITETIALVGKGIVFDTGGLSLKSTAGMCGMKHDMGGAAGLFGAFCAAVERGLVTNKKIVLHLCLAENAIGPNSFRNDDILTLYSGKTVEINNSDAEGRLVLGDGVAHATRHIADLDLVIDMATLTGAQLVATGKTHAGILANSAELEQRAMKAGMASGDLVFPLLYCPELLMKEFDSKVADMKNSVKDRGNAQTSCAGHFIESHLAEDYDKGWLHIDMAGPGSSNERGTGYGVALVLALLEE